MEDITLNENINTQAIINNLAESLSKIYIIEFSSEECIYCDEQKEIFNKLEKDFKGKVITYECCINYEGNYEFSLKNKIDLLPTTLLIINKNPEWIIGFKDYEFYKAKIKEIQAYCLNCKNRGKKSGSKIKCKLTQNSMFLHDNCEEFL